MLPDIRQPIPRVRWKQEALNARAEAKRLRRELARINKELCHVPTAVRVLCRIVGRMLRGKDNS